MAAPLVVLDTNVLVAALRSRQGASFRLMELMGRGHYQHVVSVPLVLEYEAAMLQKLPAGLTAADVDVVLNYVCAEARLQEVFYLWRPTLRDPKDDLVLEAAVAGQCDGIVTFNTRDFDGAGPFGLWVERPSSFLQRIGDHA